MLITTVTTPKVATVANWYGSNRMLAEHVGRTVGSCKWVGVPFCGGMSELPYLKANVMLVSDLHRHVINLAVVIRDDREALAARLADLPFHPDVLAAAQAACRKREAGVTPAGDSPLLWAADYFITTWMARADSGGTAKEFDGAMSIRWKSGGGDSAVRFRSAIESLVAWQVVMRKCTFVCLDVFEFLAQALERDVAENGLYMDPPFPTAGRPYKFNAGADDAAERDWHTRLRDAATRFNHAKVVMRFYDHPLIRELYTEDYWTWNLIPGGRKSSNDGAPEVLLARTKKVFVATEPANLF